MKANALGQLRNLFIIFLYVLSVVIGFPGLVQADTKPYFKVYEGDVFAGGAFSKLAVCDTSSGYHTATMSPSLSNQYNGGILAYARSGAGLYGAGSSTNLAGFSLGVIQGQSSSPSPDLLYGFYTGLASSVIGSLSFAGPGGVGGSTSWGGLWQGTTAQAHCIPDYFSKQSSPTPIGSIGNLSTMSGQYLVTTGTILPIGAGIINKNQHLTIFVDGNVYINGDIAYADRSTYDADTVPKFALVVRGNIYVDPGVKRLDGVYIAQPTTNTSADTGVIWSCHDNSTTTPKDSFVRSCTNQLVVNGAFIAGQVNLLRIPGDVATATPGEAAGSANIAEVFNYTPEMILGGPFFNPTSTNASKIESLISLPPVF